jgi:glutamate--cysteine ligase
MARDVTDAMPIGSRDDLIGWIAAGAKPASPLRIGTEHEKFPYRLADASPVPYDGPAGIRALLEAMAVETGWAPILEDGRPIGLLDEAGGAAISLEPGGQFELSGAPLEDLHATAAETRRHLEIAGAVGERLGIGFLMIGASPVWRRAETPAMPKARYRIMADYMPKVGSRGLDMMFRTSTVQVNLDYRSEADMVEKLRFSVALQPLATALFASSPFMDGRRTGYLSTRSAIWLDTDPDRTGMLPFAFEDGFGYERYVDYALDVPMYFVKRGETYHDVAGRSFRDLLAGTLPGLPGERPFMSDWANHLTTIFPEVRLKRYLEMRGADVGPLPMIVALSAFWVGLLYDDAARGAALDLVRGWSAEDRAALRRAVPVEGLRADAAGRPLLHLAREVVGLSAEGLARRGRIAPAFGGAMRDESAYLDPLRVIAETGESLADRFLAADRADWPADLRAFAGRIAGQPTPEARPLAAADHGG